MAKSFKKESMVKLKLFGKDADTFMDVVSLLTKKPIGYNRLELKAEQLELLKWIDSQIKK